MPCPHHDIKIVQRSNRQSAVAAAAYQSGERLFSEYDQKQKYYAEKRGIVHTEIMLPPHAPPEYADRNTLWNAAEAIEKQWNSQLARRIVLAIPREIPPEQHADLLRDYCREFFVSKGMIADFAIHDKQRLSERRFRPGGESCLLHSQVQAISAAGYFLRSLAGAHVGSMAQNRSLESHRLIGRTSYRRTNLWRFLLQLHRHCLFSHSCLCFCPGWRSCSACSRKEGGGSCRVSLNRSQIGSRA